MFNFVVLSLKRRFQFNSRIVRTHFASKMSLLTQSYYWRPYATGRLEGEKMSRKDGNPQSRAIFFRNSAVLSHPAVLLRKIPIRLTY